MMQSHKKETFAILTALSLTVLLFMSDKVFAESKVKNKIEINGVEYINEEIATDGSIKTDIDVSVKNNQGSIKYKVNGEEKNIQISPNKNMSQEIKDDNSGNDNKTDKTSTEKAEETQRKVIKRDENTEKIAEDLIEAMMQAVDNLLSRISDLFS